MLSPVRERDSAIAGGSGVQIHHGLWQERNCKCFVVIKSFGSPTWIRTTINGSKGRCPTVRRSGISYKASLSTRNSSALPVRVESAVQRGFIGSAFDIEDTGRRRASAYCRFFHNHTPRLIGISNRILRNLAQVTLAH
jgi:hypothetical protein